MNLYRQTYYLTGDVIEVIAIVNHKLATINEETTFVKKKFSAHSQRSLRLCGEFLVPTPNLS